MELLGDLSIKFYSLGAVVAGHFASIKKSLIATIAVEPLYLATEVSREANALSIT